MQRGESDPSKLEANCSFYAFCKSMSISEVVYFYHNVFCSILDAQPPPLDPVDSVAEFSHTHYSRDDDLISLQVEPHRSVHMYSVTYIYVQNVTIRTCHSSPSTVH